MSNKKRIDVHCHVFDVMYVLRELKEILFAQARGTYPFKKAYFLKGLGTSAPGFLSHQSAIEIIKYFAEFGWAFFTDSESHFSDIKKRLEQNLGENNNAVIVPLMMDVFYMYAYSDEETMPEIADRKDIDIDTVNRIFEDHDSKFKDLIIEELKNVYSSNPEGDVLAELEKIEQKIESIFGHENDRVFSNSMENEVFLTSGFRGHMEKLESLKETYKDAILPFLAVDPRRPGIMKLVKDKVGRDKPFHGIKLYTRLGYLPDNNVLLPELYEFCIEKDIPIVVHCSESGFPKDGWKIPFPVPHGHFADPSKWEPILKDYPTLRINFAHFGGRLNDWRETIIKLMETYDNVYADLAYFKHEEDLKEIKHLMEKNPTVRKRLMFGTDYTIMMFDDRKDGHWDKCTLDNYFSNFNIFNRDQLNALTLHNPSNFLMI